MNRLDFIKFIGLTCLSLVVPSLADSIHEFSCGCKFNREKMIWKPNAKFFSDWVDYSFNPCLELHERGTCPVLGVKI